MAMIIRYVTKKKIFVNLYLEKCMRFRYARHIYTLYMFQDILTKDFFKETFFTTV